MNYSLRNIFLTLLLVLPDVAYAHMPIKGINNFYNGVLHPALVPSHLLLLIALGVLFGQQGPKENQAAIKVFLLATVLGLVTAGFSAGGNVEVILLIGASIIGLLVAASLHLPVYWCAIIGALAGFVIGLDSAQETLLGKEKIVSLFGTGVGVYLLMVYATGFTYYFNKKPWQKVGVRIIGSWVAASSFLVLSLLLSSTKL
jgi:urease accessory protein